MTLWSSYIFLSLLALPVIADARGNVLGLFDTVELTLNWNASRPTGYGAVPEYRPVPLADNGDLAASSAWRGRWPDLSGLYWLGDRYYDPEMNSTRQPMQ